MAQGGTSGIETTVKRLLVVQRYVPDYRVPFFRELRTSLSASDFQLTLAAGQVHGHHAERQDDRTAEAADKLLTTQTIKLAGKQLLSHDIGPVLREIKPHLAIVEQALKNVDSYYLLGRQRLKGSPGVAFWGQGKDFSSHQGRLANSLKQWTTRRGEWFFAYTQEGAEYVIERGMPASAVTVLNNTLDTEALTRDLESVTDEDVQAFRKRYSLIRGRTAIFIGGVDHHKGIQFLLDSSERVAKEISGFKLLVVGSGAESDLVRRHQATSMGVIYLGRLTGFEKAVALSAADIMMIPEWVGLVAVDSLVAGCPIATTHHSSHAPEFAYLVDRRNAFVFRHEISAYAHGVAQVLRDTTALDSAQRQAMLDARLYPLQDMVGRFTHGVENWWHLNASKRSVKAE